jgi:hypothetical protein
MNYAIFGVMAGIALLTTTILSVLPVQRALAVCAGDPSLGTALRFACAHDPRVGGGALASAPGSIATANNANFGGVGHACTLISTRGPVMTVCVP